MRLPSYCFLPAALALLTASHIHAKAAFTHFIVSNAANYTVDDWQHDIALAQQAHITAFALNVAQGQTYNDVSIARAFVAADNQNFKLFFSFDYAGNGPWLESDVVSYLFNYISTGAYYYYSGRPFVSTFEGWQNAADWHSIKTVTGCFFVPDWSSLGAKAALEQADGVADGLFSWAAWPWGGQNIDTYIDASYRQYLNGKPYMMAGDNLWFDRWNEVMYVQPEWVEIISWNDYGESHYIGPIRENALSALASAPFNYVENMPHDSWRTFLPYVINMYVNNATSFTPRTGGQMVLMYIKTCRIGTDSHCRSAEVLDLLYEC
ncbi:glycoside hydrolase [Diplogelasinospora grovesii]|uniref:Glycoside hydrolase n=1 Tax=Diplogelasinospora grovesii TaxID=303347 RepID=A0AAN6S9B3_9PEZI|nr:glycoside hydrolase [Diplogelasinospora grovesii]